MIDYGIFQSKNVPHIATSALPEQPTIVENGTLWHYRVDTASECQKEETRLTVGWRGIWHGNHFDKWTGSFADHLDRISNLPPLNCMGVDFSPVAYSFGINQQALTYFLTKSPWSFQLCEHMINVPPMAEVNLRLDRGKSCFVRPIRGYHDESVGAFEYMGIPFQNFLSVDDNGYLTGSLAKEIMVKTLDSSAQIEVTLNKDFPVMISPNGELFVRYASGNSMKVSMHRVKLVSR